MVNREQSEDRGSDFDAAQPYPAGSSPVGDEKQATQELTHQAVLDAAASGEQVADEAEPPRGETATPGAGAFTEAQRGAAERVRGAADALRQRSQQLTSSERTRQMTGMAGERMGHASDYLRQTNTQEMLDKVRVFTRANPGKALLIAAAAGALIGRRLLP